MFVDTTTNKFSLYNLNGTPFLLNIATPNPIMPDYSIGYITNTMFDCDSNTIEYAFMSYLNPHKPFRVLRTDGTVLLQVDSAQGPVCYGCLAGTKEIVPIVNTQEGAKLFLFKTNANNVQKTLIYGLCSSLPESINRFDFSKQNSFVKLYPNPTTMSVNFEITPPSNLGNFDLIIFDSHGSQIKKETVSATNNKFTLDISSLSDGVYYYSFTTKDKNYQTGKFIITK